MTGLAARFFGSAVIYAVLGMALGTGHGHHARSFADADACAHPGDRLGQLRDLRLLLSSVSGSRRRAYSRRRISGWRRPAS